MFSSLNKNNFELFKAVADAISGAPIIAQIERNGLQHGLIELEAGSTVLQISWNSIGTLLAVRLADKIEIWRQGNYHWYRQIEYSVQCSVLWWDQIDSNRLWFCSNSRLTSVSVDQFINHTGAQLCVQNGSRVNYTDYNQGTGLFISGLKIFCF